MRRHARPHPLQSARFWFVILAAVGVTAAWKFELVHFGPPHAQQAAAKSEVDLGAGLSADQLDESTFTDGYLGQSEPIVDGMSAAEPPVQLEPDDDTDELPRVMPRVTRTQENPFGPARPEFQPVSDVAEQELPAAAAVGTGINSDAGLSGSVVLTADHEQESPAQGPFPARQATATAATTAAPAAAPGAVDFTAIDALLEAGTPDADIEALRALSKLYWEQPAARPELKDRINATSRRIYFQPQPYYPDGQAHEVQSGDTLEAIARQYDVSWEYLARLNRADAAKIRPGQKLKVIKGPFSAIVDLSDYELTVHCHGYYVYKFPVGIGQDGATPIGTFQVQDKVVNPPYNGPEGAIAADDPANPIGERWISLGDGYGIHGTIEPESIGKGESRGCVRMHNKDVEIVYDLLTVGSEVVIQR